MSIFKTIGTILPTAGNILGQLLTSFSSDNENASTVTYDFGSGLICGFKKDATGEIKLHNASLPDENVITFAVPAIGDIDAETVTIPSGEHAPLSDVFKRCAELDATKFMICGSAQDTQAIGVNASGCFHFAAGGRNIPVDGATTKAVGSYLTVTCYENKAVFESRRSMRQITSANFWGSHDSSITMTDVTVSSTAGGGTKAEVYFPKAFPKGSYLDIDVEVDMNNATQIIAEQRIKTSKSNEADLMTIRNLAAKIRNKYETK